MAPSSGLRTKMGQTVSPETLVFNLNQTPGSYPKEDNFVFRVLRNTINFTRVINNNHQYLHLVVLGITLKIIRIYPVRTVQEECPDFPWTA